MAKTLAMPPRGLDGFVPAVAQQTWQGAQRGS